LPALPNFIYFKGLNATAVGSFGRQVSMLKLYLGVLSIEIGLEHTPFVALVYFFFLI
jgi:hypothetical protein